MVKSGRRRLHSGGEDPQLSHLDSWIGCDDVLMPGTRQWCVRGAGGVTFVQVGVGYSGGDLWYSVSYVAYIRIRSEGFFQRASKTKRRMRQNRVSTDIVGPEHSSSSRAAGLYSCVRYRTCIRLVLFINSIPHKETKTAFGRHAIVSPTRAMLTRPRDSAIVLT